MKDSKYSLKHLTKCPICSAHYKQSQFQTLKEDSVKAIFHTTCLECGTAMITFVSKGQQGVVSMSVATDLSIREAIDFFKKEAVSADNVLNVYRNLNK